ncbi:ATP-dependent DNA ligase [Embleya sp. MST-111070]|uniref:ATP-dependent DNA ligase n=1 Tax=Embleya sp. MST-111070 TaxID=3398231 RepID=UPI003F736B33
MPTAPTIAPMLATPGVLPGLGQEDGWAFEEKFDGARAVISVLEDGTVRVTSRRGTDVSVAYPELVEDARDFGTRAAVLDGEIVAVGAGGRPDFGLLQARMGVSDARRAAALARVTPVTLMLFDVMWLDGRSLLDVPYLERREILARLALRGGHVRVPAHVVGHAARAWEAVVAAGGEGLLAKRIHSGYEPGVRSAAWRKVKAVETVDVVIGGWRPGRGSLRDLPGSVLVGRDTPEGLRYLGSVGSGVSERERRELAGYLGVLARDTSPFTGPVEVPDARWVHPRLVAEITVGAWTRAGRVRHPVWQRLRPDLTRLD